MGDNPIGKDDSMVKRTRGENEVENIENISLVQNTNTNHMNKSKVDYINSNVDSASTDSDEGDVVPNEVVQLNTETFEVRTDEDKNNKTCNEIQDQDQGTKNRVNTENTNDVPKESEPDVLVNEEEPLQNVDQTSKDLDKSKRVSGQGMERQKQIKTPRSRRVHNVRAISTPQVNKTVLGDNVTFLGESGLDLSAITVLSPPSVVSDPDSRRGSTSARNKDDTDAVSFRFRKGGKDMFEELVDAKDGAAGGKRKSEEGRAEDTKRLANGGRKRGSSACLDVIHEEGRKN